MTKPPLTAIRILDLSRLLPGPYATLLLADMGAEVIKVETPRVGDYARLAPAEFGGNVMFQLINRGKKSVALNYRNKRGRQLFLRLAEQADVIIESFRPGSVEKWGIDYQAVRERNPKIIYCSLSGYGQSGPYRDRSGHDLNYIALAGLLGLNASPGGPPVVPGVQIADLAGAMMAALGILGALLGRDRSGEGVYLDIAMMDAVVSWIMPLAGGWWYGTGQEPQAGRMPLAGGLPCYNIYQTADGDYLTLGALEPPFWSKFCEVAGRPDLLPAAFDAGRIAEVADLFRSRTRKEWLDLFEGVAVCLEPINSLLEAFADPQIIHRGMTAGAAEPDRQAPFLGSPYPFPIKEGAAPALGRDTVELLAAAGIPEEEIEALLDRKVIAVSDSEG